ncbi:MAG TPA: GH1 family beta-glucosidase [Gaiellaceae bacterium]|nr:GH1 family beta-glucosidase [Gaiellaceae bacterium]
MSEEVAGRFPAGHLWGAATADYQIEGAWDEDGKEPGIWDAFCRRPGAVANGDTGDVACDHYHRWREDVDLIAELGLDAYRFGISWPRVISERGGGVNEAGLDFYDRLVEALVERGVRPLPTLYHWNLPQALQDRGGWGERETVERFGTFAAVVAERLGDRVEDWITINEPAVVAFLGHATGVHAPGLRDWRLALRVAHHLLLAHAEAAASVRAASPAGRVGIALDLSPCHPASGSDEDAAAARRWDGYRNRWFLEPLFGRGYPADLADWYGDLIPGDLVRELDAVDGELDFLGVNYYTRQVVQAADGGILAAEAVAPAGERTAMGWEVYPRGLRELLVRLHADYGDVPLVVTENGAAYGDELEDADRIDYLARHFAAAADALDAGVPLTGYFVWSLLDNFEWAEGYAKRFGLIRVDYETQRRTVKASGRWYRDLIAASRRAAPRPS